MKFNPDAALDASQINDMRDGQPFADMLTAVLRHDTQMVTHYVAGHFASLTVLTALVCAVLSVSIVYAMERVRNGNTANLEPA